MKRHQLLFLIISLLALTCKKEPPPAVHIPTLTLTAVDASCTEAWLKLTTTQVPATVRLVRDGQPVSDFRLLTSDTLVVDEGLLPRRTYTYKAYRLEVRGSGFEVVDSTTQATVTTMDTTSHNFTWQIDTLGDGGGSVLYDVAIINDTLAYAVGEVYKRDSLGNWDPLRYNLAKWNGQQWELKRVTVNFRGNLITPPLYGVYAFTAADIWIAAGMAIHGSESNWVGHDVRALTGVDALSFTKCWGVSSTDMYFVGLAGSIAHYDGVRWRRIESGTTLPIWDVHGARDERTGSYEIICVASNHSFPEGRKLLKVQGSSVTALPDSGLPWSIDAVWHVPGRKYIVVGDGVWHTLRLGIVWESVGGLPNLYTTSVTGVRANDIFIGAAFLDLFHFNGVTWRNYFPLMISGAFGAVQMKGDRVVAVGVIGSGFDDRGIIVVGRRTP
jgi:hypothetical protein